MSLRDYAQIVRKRWRIAIACFVLVMGAVSALTLLAKPTYSATVRLFVSASNSDATPLNAYQGSLFTQDRVLSYAGLVNTPQVTGPVAQQLGLSPSEASSLSGHINATVPANTVLIDVTVTDRNAVRARNIANAIGARFPVVVSNLETVNAQQRSPVQISVAEPATTPGAPTSPRRKLDLAFGFLLAMAIAIGAALVRESFDATVTNAAEMARLFGVPTIGTVPRDPSASRKPIVFDTGGRSNRLESFRKLRTGLTHLDPAQSPKSILVTSCVTGEGKTTTSLNLAIALAQLQREVVIVDADLRRPRMASLLAAPPAPGLANVVAGRDTASSALRGTRFERVRVLATRQAPPNPTEILSAPAFRDVIHELEKDADFVIIDASPILPAADAAVLSTVVDAVIVVVQHGKTKKRQLHAALDELRAVNAPIIGIVLNMVPPGGPDGYDGYDYVNSNVSRYVPAAIQLPVAPVDEPVAATRRRSNGHRAVRDVKFDSL